MSSRTPALASGLSCHALTLIFLMPLHQPVVTVQTDANPASETELFFLLYKRFIYIYFTCVCECLNVCMCTTCMPGPKTARRWHRMPWNWSFRQFLNWSMCMWEPNPRLLQEQQVLFLTEPSLQIPQDLFLARDHHICFAFSTSACKSVSVYVAYVCVFIFMCE